MSNLPTGAALINLLDIPSSNFVLSSSYFSREAGGILEIPIESEE